MGAPLLAVGAGDSAWEPVDEPAVPETASGSEQAHAGSENVVASVEDAVASNSFPDAPRYPVSELRTALDLPEEIPIVECDVRRRASSRDVLMTLMHFLHALAMAKAPA